MHHTSVLIIIHCCIVSCGKQITDFSNEKRAEEGQFPFAVYIEDIFFPGIDVPFDCSGSLVSTQWVVSAAHCVQNFLDGRVLIADRMSLVAGILDSDKCDFCQRRNSKNIYVHPEFRDKVKVHNVCLIKTFSPFELNAYINSISLSQNTHLISVGQQEQCTLVAFNRNRPSQKNVVLVFYTKPINHYIHCDRTAVDLHRLCSGSACGTKSCPVGAGGSLVCQSTLVGVISGVEKRMEDTDELFCSLTDYHIVYHYTGSYLQWMQSVAPSNLRAKDVKFDSQVSKYKDIPNIASSPYRSTTWNMFSTIVLSLLFCDRYFRVVK